MRQGRDGSRLTKIGREVIPLRGINARRPEHVPRARTPIETNVISGFSRAGYGHGSRWNARPVSAISSSRARDGGQHCLWGSSCQPFSLSEVVAELPEEQSREGRLQTIRYIAVLVPGFVAGSRAVYAIRCWQEWPIWAHEIRCWCGGCRAPISG
jgi:hypothetical protein